MTRGHGAATFRAALVACLAFVAQDASAQAPCDPTLYIVVFEVIVDPAGKLTHFKFGPTVDCQKRPANPPISAAWRKTVCVTFALDRNGPTYAAGEAPRPGYSFMIFNSARPGVVSGPRHTGRTPQDPAVHVREGILDEKGSEKDGSNVCSGDLGPIEFK